MQVEVVLAELAAVVAGRDLDDSRTAGCTQPGAQRPFDGWPIETVHDDLQH